jgi:hypothetical protein
MAKRRKVKSKVKRRKVKSKPELNSDPAPLNEQYRGEWDLEAMGLLEPEEFTDDDTEDFDDDD